MSSAVSKDRTDADEDNGLRQSPVVPDPSRYPRMRAEVFAQAMGMRMSSKSLKASKIVRREAWSL